MSADATVRAFDLQRIFGGRSVRSDIPDEYFRSDSWRLEFRSGELVASGVIGENVCEVRAPANSSAAFSFTVPAWLMAKVAPRLGAGMARISRGSHSTTFSGPGVEFRVLDSVAPEREIESVVWPGASDPRWRIGAAALRRAIRLAAAVANRSTLFTVSGIQLSFVDADSLQVSATDRTVRADSLLPLEPIGGLGGSGMLRRATSVRHFNHGIALVGSTDEPLEIALVEGALVLESSLGRVRLPILELTIPVVEFNSALSPALVVDRSRLLEVLEAVAALNESNMNISLSVAAGQLSISGGTEKFGEVRAALPVAGAPDAAPFELWRAPLEDWLGAAKGKTVSASWINSSTVRWLTESTELRSILTMTTS